jgi:hypothetical protein
MEYADIDISVEWDEYWDGEALFEYGYSQFEGCDNEAIVPITVNIEGEYDEFYFAIYNRDLTDEDIFTDDMFYEDLNYGYSMKSVILSVPMDTEMTVVAVAYDQMYMPSKLFRKVIYLTEDGASEPETFKAYGGEPSSMVVSRSLTPSKSSIGDIRVDRTQSIEIEVSDADRKAIESERKAALQAEIAKRNKSLRNETRRIAR